MKRFIALIMLAAVLFLALGCAPTAEPINTPQYTYAPPVSAYETVFPPTASLPPATTALITLAPTPTLTPAATPSGWLEDGIYCVGTDIREGEYFIRATGIFSAYIEVCSDDSGTFESIVVNDNTSSFTFITVKTGQYLKLERGEFIQADLAEIPAATNGVFACGTYRVGKDIQPGVYVLTPDSNLMGNYEVASTSSHTLFDMIASENFSEPVTVSVTEGQYLTVTRASFALQGV